eukprot:3562419-Amphidinium_carterae.1
MQGHNHDSPHSALLRWLWEHSLVRLNMQIGHVIITMCLSGGDMNFWYNMQPFYDVENLNTYPSVNPAREKGQQLMDAGTQL